MLKVMGIEIDGIYYQYDYDDKTIGIDHPPRKIPRYSGAFIIPPSVEWNGNTYAVQSIAPGAFSECARLTSIDIPDTVTDIDNSAFCGCRGLTAINIPSSVKRIGDSAFMDCSSLTSVTIPGSVTSIEPASLSSCASLTSIIVEADNPNYDSRNNCNAIIDSKTNILIAGCVKTVIPDDVVGIDEFVFIGCDGLTTINIPNSVTSIGTHAFYGCKDLVSIDIPNSVKIIEDKAFAECPSLNKFQCHYQSLDDVSIDKETFDTDVFESCTLIVPPGTESIYQQHEVFGKFKKIEIERATCS